MASPSSSRRGSIDSTTSSASEEKMQIFVRNAKGDTTTLNVPPTTTIAALHSLLPAQPTTTITTTPPPRLTFYSRTLSLSPTSTLASNNIPPSSLLHLLPPMSLRGGMPPKKARCGHKECKEPAQRIVGDCGFCGGKFCGKHRLLESHACTGLEGCKKEERERNREKLEGERTAVVRGV